MKAECEFSVQDFDGSIPALQAGKFDAIIVETTGLADPATVTLVRDAARVDVAVGADGSIDVR